MTREELSAQARKIQLMDPKSSEAQAAEDALVSAIQDYTEVHPFETDEMGIVAGDTDEGPTHKICVSQADMQALVEAARVHHRIALRGQPGFGRVYAAQELAYILIGRETPDHVVIAQFDADYTFEYFMGTGPASVNFLRNGGLFYRLCRTAAKSGEPYVLVINETAPGRVGEIFQQLEELTETGAGQEALNVLYGTSEPFAVPDNVYIYALTAVTGSDALPPRSFTSRPLKASMQISELETEAEMGKLPELQGALNIVEAINMVVTKNLTLGPKYSIHQNFVCPCTLKSGQDVLGFTVERDLNPLITEYCGKWTKTWARMREENSEQNE